MTLFFIALVISLFIGFMLGTQYDRFRKWLAALPRRREAIPMQSGDRAIKPLEVQRKQ